MWLWLEPGAKLIVFQKEAVLLKPENHPSVEQVLAATKSDATSANVPKTLFSTVVEQPQSDPERRVAAKGIISALGRGAKGHFWGALYCGSKSENRAVALARSKFSLFALSMHLVENVRQWP